MIAALHPVFHIISNLSKLLLEIKLGYKVYNYIYTNAGKVRMICESFPKIIFRFLNFSYLHSFTMTLTKYRPMTEWLMINKLEELWKELVVAYVKVPTTLAFSTI